MMQPLVRVGDLVPCGPHYVFLTKIDRSLIPFSYTAIGLNPMYVKTYRYFYSQNDITRIFTDKVILRSVAMYLYCIGL